MKIEERCSMGQDGLGVSPANRGVRRSRTMLSAVLALVAGVLGSGCAREIPRDPVARWIDESAVPLRELGGGGDRGEVFGEAFERARVVGLGEATHGQRESFEAKRAITMHLIEHHGFRIVAYEASASAAKACDAYISGASDDLKAGMGGLGMMIWQIEENAALLRDLRAWNQRASAEERVRFVGVDVQDAEAAAASLERALKDRWSAEAAQVLSIRDRLNDRVSAMFSGNRAGYDELVRETDELGARLRAALAGAGLSPAEAAAFRGALREFEGCVRMHLTPGGRDRAMGELTVGALEDAGANAKMVLWAHNMHICRSPLRYLESDELAAGGHIARSLGDRYYAIGFAFGEGEFVANDLDNGTWIFRTYGIDPPSEGMLEYPFHAVLKEASIVDLRSQTGEEKVEHWKREGHPQRWLGGYRVPANIREMSRDATKFLPTYTREAFDALVFLPRTTGSTPIRSGSDAKGR